MSDVDPQVQNDELLAASVARHLRERGVVWDAPILAFAELTSTNDRVKALARGGAREWTSVVARRQTRGRGRQGRVWASPPGNLYLSCLLRPDDQAALNLLPLAAGVAVCESVREWGLAVSLKWPNDALVGERKLAGVLVEASSSSHGLEHVVIGIGVNLDWDPAQVPELAATATSVRAAGGCTPEVGPAAAALLAHLAPAYGLLLRDPQGTLAAWRERAAPWWGERVQVEAAGSLLCGSLRDVDDRGALLVEDDDGRLHRLFSGEVARLRPASTV